MPNGYLLRPMANNSTVAKHITGGISIHCIHCPYLNLGQERFHQILRYLGLLKGHSDFTLPNQKDSIENECILCPVSPDWKCPGVPASPNYPAQACGRQEGTHFYGGGNLAKSNPYFWWWCCSAICHSKMRIREADLLQSREKNTKEDLKRLFELQEWLQ